MRATAVGGRVFRRWRPPPTLRGAVPGAMVCASLGLWRVRVVSGHHGWTDPEIIALIALSALAAAVGFAVRNRRAYVAAVEERARRNEQTREEEARRRVVDQKVAGTPVDLPAAVELTAYRVVHLAARMAEGRFEVRALLPHERTGT